MATTGVFNGTNLLLKVDTVVIGHTTSCSISFTHDLPDATTKDSQGWSEVISGVRGATITFDGLVDYSDATNVIDLFDLIANRTKVDVTFGTATSGDTIFSAEAYLDSLENTADMESPVAYSGSLTITGPVTKVVNGA